MIPQYEPYIKSEYADAVLKQINTGWIGSGKTVKRFEDMFAEYIDSKYAISCSSGTAAIIIALKAIGIEYTDRIAVPDYSFIAPTNAVRFIGGIPIIIDITENSLSMNPKLLEDQISCLKAVIFVNHNGYVGDDLLQIRDICNAHSIPFIEDAACALGQRYKNKHAGTFGDIGCFSFSVPKILTTGQGGMIVTNDSYFATRCREVVDQGSTTWRQDGYHKNIGANFKFNDILAAYGISQLSILEELLQKRKHVYDRYISNGIKLHTYSDMLSTWMNVITNIDAYGVQQKLYQDGIQSKMYYRSVHDCLGHTHNKLSVAEKVYETSLYLPSSLGLPDADIDFVCEKVNSIIGQYDE